MLRVSSLYPFTSYFSFSSRSRFILLFSILFSLHFAVTLYAQPLTGIKTIGGSTPDYSGFGSAISALTSHGVGAGGVTFNVRAGRYNETMTIPAITGSSATNPVVFQRESGAVTVSATTVSSSSSAAIELFGCRYVTFDGISVEDTSTGGDHLAVGYWITNASATQGSQYNTIKNCSIRLRIGYTTIGVYHNYYMQPTSASGTQSYNHYLNLKISKCQTGVEVRGLWFNIYDEGVEIGSTSSNLNDTNRFVIGGLPNDTIGGSNFVDGIYASGTRNLSIHDIDISNVISSTTSDAGHGASGISCYTDDTAGTTRIYNNRIFNLSRNAGSGTGYVMGIADSSYDRALCYNNMVWGLSAAGLSVGHTAFFGIHSSGAANLDNNTIWMDGGTAMDFDEGLDTVRNNILMNTSTTGFCITTYGVSEFFSDHNCFYLPNRTSGGVVNWEYSNNYDLASWRTYFHNDSNSVVGNPMFISADNLHIRSDTVTIVEGGGVPISYITTDIDSDARNPVHPDIGADEGNFISASVRNETVAVPKEFSLSPIYPNPFNATAVIRFALPVAASVRGELFDITGRKVATLVSGKYNAGSHSVRFDGKGFASGVYVVRVSAGKVVREEKMVLVK